MRGGDLRRPRRRRSPGKPETPGESREGGAVMAQQEQRFKHKIICDCGAELEIVAVTQYEEGQMGTTKQSIEGKEFWQHMLHCLGE